MGIMMLLIYIDGIYFLDGEKGGMFSEGTSSFQSHSAAMWDLAV